MFSEVERRGLAVLVDQAGDVVLGVHAVLVRVDDVREGALSADYSEAAVEGARDGPMNGSLCAGRVLAYGLKSDALTSPSAQCASIFLL